MDTYVINLDRSEDRLREFRRQNNHMPEIHRFSAIDGSTIDRDRLIESNTFAPGLHYTDGAVGAALSHLFFWEAAKSENAAITVCEDDAILHRRFPDLSARFLAALDDDWDLVLWGWNFDSILLFDLMPGVSPCLATFNQEQMRAGAQIFQELSIVPRPFRLFRAFGTVCYTISPRGAEKLLKSSLPLRPLKVEFPRVSPEFPNNGIDIAMNDAYPAMKAFVSIPPLAITRNEHAISTVQIRRQIGND
jgi:glycosyl transferase, family 25